MKVRITESDIAKMVMEITRRVLNENLDVRSLTSNVSVFRVMDAYEQALGGDKGELINSPDMFAQVQQAYDSATPVQQEMFVKIVNGENIEVPDIEFNEDDVNFLEEDALAGAKAVAGRFGNSVKNALGMPSYSKGRYPGSYLDTFKDASFESDYWKLGKDMENNPSKYVNVAPVISKVQKFAKYGVISQESAREVIELLNQGNVKDAGHVLCYGTYTFGVDKGEEGTTGYERRHGIRQL